MNLLKHFVFAFDYLTHWGRVRYICVIKSTIIGSDNGLVPDRRQAIIWTNVGIVLYGPLGTNFSEILIEIHTFSFKKMHMKMSPGKWRPYCLRLNVLRLLMLTYAIEYSLILLATRPNGRFLVCNIDIVTVTRFYAYSAIRELGILEASQEWWH